jgi:PilZ domain
MQPERPNALTFPFDAQAEVSLENTEDRIPARVTQIGTNGCFLQISAPFEVGAVLFLKIFVEEAFFETHATVLYSQPNVGMGVAFRKLKPFFVSVLQKWLLEAMKAKHKPSN